MKEKEEIRLLKAELAEKEELVEEFLDKNLKYLDRITKLEKAVEDLQLIVLTFQGKKPPPKNSTNSDLPPSKDTYRKDRRRSRRVKSNKKVGGQKGHKGFTLDYSKTPEEEIDHVVDKCLECGLSLNLRKRIFHSSRQVVDIPPPSNPVVTQHNTYLFACSCGCINQSLFPEEVKSRVQYGFRLRALINYLSVRQYVPYKRLTELLSDCFGIKLSSGTISNTLKRTAIKAEGAYKGIKDSLLESGVIGSDETPVFVNGKRHTLWVWQTKLLTFLKVSSSRAGYHIRDEFPKGFPESVLCSDQYAAQLNTPAKFHQSCWAHLDRKLIYLLELQNSKWIKQIRSLFYEAVELKKEHGHFKYKSKRPRIIEERFNQLLFQKLHCKTVSEIVKMQESLIRHRDTLFTFLYHELVPPDNNSSEQAIRCAKVKVKISGGFKSLHQQFAIIRSIIDTAIKNQLNILHTLQAIEQGKSFPLVNT